MTAIFALAHWFFDQLKSRKMDLAIIFAVSALIYLSVKLFGIEAFARQHLALQSMNFETKLIIAGALFLWSCVLFTTFVPLGTVTVLIAGYLLGIAAGFIQFGALCVSSLFLYSIFDRRKHTQSIKDYTQNSVILGGFKAVEGHPILTVCLLRIIPVIPSAACVFISQIMNVSFRNMMTATLYSGWIRPVAFAYLGSKAASLAI